MSSFFDDVTLDLVKSSFRRAQVEERDRVAEELDRALEYTRNDMLEDVEDNLSLQYPKRQKQGTERILPATIPLTSFFVKEQARLYKGKVKRKLIHRETKEEASEDLTKRYEDFLGEEEYNSAMTEVLTRLVMFEECGVLPTVEAGHLDMRIFKAHDVWPLREPTATSNPARAEAYDENGYVIDNRIDLKAGTEQVRTFTLIKPKGTTIYEGTIDRVRSVVADVPNAIEWPQLNVDKRGRPTGGFTRKPLQMFTPLHSYYATDKLFQFAVPPVYTTNRILNIQFSVLHDIFRWQAGPTPILNLIDPEKGPQQRVIGVNAPLVLAAQGESASFMASPADFEGLARFLMLYARISGLLLRMAPDDLSVEANAPQSGFAKTIENLPKIRAVEDLIPWVVKAEKRLHPRVAGVGIWLRKLPEEIEQYDVEPEFEPPKVPLSADERTKIELHDLKLGLTTAAQLLSERSGLSVEVAKQTIEDNRKENESTLEALQAGQGQQQGAGQPGSFANRVNARRGAAPGNPQGRGGPQPRAGQVESGSRTDRGLR